MGGWIVDEYFHPLIFIVYSNNIRSFRGEHKKCSIEKTKKRKTI